MHMMNVRVYTPFGFASVVPDGILVGFNGERRDSSLECDFLGQGRRVYSPVLMRFYSADALSPFYEGGLNAYSYCEGDPVNYSDPSAMNRWATIVRQKVFASGRRAELKRELPLQQQALDLSVSPESRITAGHLKRTGSPIEQLHVSPKRMKDSASANRTAVDDVVNLMQGERGESVGKEADKMLDYLKRRAAAYDEKPHRGPLSTLTEREKIVGLAIGEGLMFDGSITYYSGVKKMYPNMNLEKANSLAARIRKYANSVRKSEGLE